MNQAELHQRFLRAFEDDTTLEERDLMIAHPSLLPVFELWFLRGFEAGQMRFREMIDEVARQTPTQPD